MKKLLWTSAMALTAVACLTACDESTSGASNAIASYKAETALPDTCEMEVAKAGDTYFACFDNKWVEVTDSATVEEFKEGLDEEELKKKLEELEEKLEEAMAAAKKPSSSSKKVESSAEVDEGGDEPESSASEEECTGRRCKTGNSSSSKKSSGGNGGSGSGEGGEGSSPSSAESSSPSSAESSSPSSAESSSPSSANSSTGSSPSSAESSSPSSAESSSPSSAATTCGDATYNPETEWCRPTDNKVIALANIDCCGKAAACHTAKEERPEMYYDITDEFCAVHNNTPTRYYKKVTINGVTWMAENLSYKTASGSYCYGKTEDVQTANCATYGRLYTWAAATNATSPVCPDGWHLPSNKEMSDLIKFIDKSSDGTSSRTAGKTLKTTTGWDVNDGTDDYGFSLLPGGMMRGSDNGFQNLGETAYLLLADEEETYVFVNDVQINIYTHDSPNSARSVRCIKD